MTATEDHRVARRTVTTAFGAAAGTAFLSARSGQARAASQSTRTATGPARSGDVWAHRAAVSWSALQRYFLVPDGTGLYHEQYPVQSGDNSYSYEWPFSQAHVAALDLTGMSGGSSRYQRFLRVHQRAQQSYWIRTSTTGRPGFASYVVAPLGSGGDLFYDDNEWVGLLEVQQWLMYRNQAALRQARQIFELVVSGWDRNHSHADDGGVFWTQAPWSSSRNTVSNMPGAELGLRLHQITGEQHYLDWATKMYQWTNRWLQRSDGLYHDNLSLTGEVEETIWTYNQGVPIGVNTLGAKITGDRHYLAEAERIADAAHRYFGVEDRLAKQPPFFNSIYFKNLLLLESMTGGTTHLGRMRTWAESVWQQQRDADTGLFHFDADSDITAMIEQAAMVQVFAVLAWNPSRYRLLY